MYYIVQYPEVTTIRLILSDDTIEADGYEELSKDELWLGKYRAGDLENGIYDHKGKRLRALDNGA
jgi:hypothetical protein